MDGTGAWKWRCICGLGLAGPLSWKTPLKPEETLGPSPGIMELGSTARCLNY